ncbi:nucleolar protein 9 [Numida meleagris]|uniref:nucleolar protein 9 n=1 Tax=Numida meleagris TaxID=8996 RepID=UPI000B3D80B1|nr:nucleolar protein 9 [Numida meleagris]
MVWLIITHLIRIGVSNEFLVFFWLIGIPEEPKAKGAGPQTKGAGPLPKGAELPASFPLLLQRLADAFEQHLPSLLSPPCASLCLQGALQALQHSQSPAAARLCDAVIGLLAPPDHAPGESPLVAVLEDAERGRIMEAVLAAAPPPRLRELFQEQLKGRLLGVACHRLANHGLQRLLDHAPSDVVGVVLEELGPALGEPLARGHHGVAVALVGACGRQAELQQGALRCLFQAFGCWEPPQRRRCCVGALAALQPLEGEDPQPTLGAITPSGSRLLQLLLRFRDPSAVLGGLQALSDAHLQALALSPPGSHVWDAVMASPSVPPRARRRLVRRLKGHFLSLACHRNGSRVLDAILASASAPTRAAIAAELAPQRRALLRDPHGRGVEHRLHLELFLRSRSQWERLWAAPRGLLGALLED